MTVEPAYGREGDRFRVTGEPPHGRERVDSDEGSLNILKAVVLK